MVIYGSEQIALCPHSSLCGASPKTAAFADRENITNSISMSTLAIIVAVVGGLSIIFGSLFSIYYHTQQSVYNQIDSIADMLVLIETDMSWGTVKDLTGDGREREISRRASS